MQNQYLQAISLLKLHENSATVSVFCELFWIQKWKKANEYITIYGRLIVRCVAMETVLSSTRRTKIHSFLVSLAPYPNFGRPEIHSFQITSSNTCTLKNCIRPP